MSNYFMQHFFAQKYFDPDEYFRLGVRVPVPVVPVPGGSAAPMGFYRMQNCEWLDKESCELKDDVDKAWKKLQKKVHRDPLSKKTKTKEELERFRSKDLVSLKQKTDELFAKYHELRRAGLRDEPYTQKLKKRAEELNRCYQRVEDRLLQIQRDIERHAEENKKELEEQQKRIANLEQTNVDTLKLHLEQNKKIDDLAKSQAATARDVAELKEAVAATKTAPEPVVAVETAVSAKGESFGESLLYALPYAAGSAACFAATYWLVPDEYEILKFAGYAGGTALAGAALLRAAPALANMVSGLLIPEMSS